jgi:hypothetical protein
MSTGRKILVGAVAVIIFLSIVPFLFRTLKPLDESQSGGKARQSLDNVTRGTGQPSIGAKGTNLTASAQINRARELIQNLRSIAVRIADVQALCIAANAPLNELRSLGVGAVAAYIDEIADKTSPIPLRILLIELAASLSGRNDPRLRQALMAIIGDTTDAKSVRMQALQWIPVAGDQTDGATLVQMLPKQTDSDLEFGITRALRGFKVPNSVNIIKDELADSKSYLIRIAATHALAHQGEQEALTLLQSTVATKLAAGSDEAHAEENAVAVHGVVALGEIPDVSSLPILEGIVKNASNSISVRSKAAETIGSIGGSKAVQMLNNTLQEETNESVLVYVARGLARCGSSVDASACLQKARAVSDSYTRSELERAAHQLQGTTKP